MDWLLDSTKARTKYSETEIVTRRNSSKIERDRTTNHIEICVWRYVFGSNGRRRDQPDRKLFFHRQRITCCSGSARERLFPNQSLLEASLKVSHLPPPSPSLFSQRERNFLLVLSRAHVDKTGNSINEFHQTWNAARTDGACFRGPLSRVGRLIERAR